MKGFLSLMVTIVSLSGTAWAGTPLPNSSEPGASQTPLPADNASVLGEPVVPSQTATDNRSTQLNQQASQINQELPDRGGDRRDFVQRTLDLPETVRIRGIGGGLGVSTDF